MSRIDEINNSFADHSEGRTDFKWVVENLRVLRDLVTEATVGASYGARHDSRFPYQGPTVEVPAPLWDKIKELLK